MVDQFPQTWDIAQNDGWRIPMFSGISWVVSLKHGLKPQNDGRGKDAEGSAEA